MCECGCGDGEPIFQFPGPNKTVYVARVYPGCVNCETPVGVMITEDWGIQDLKKADFENDFNGVVIPVIEPRFVIDEVVQLCGEAIIDNSDKEHSFTVKEFLTEVETEAALQLVTNACYSTLRSKPSDDL
jgi:hypothetical protein